MIKMQILFIATFILCVHVRRRGGERAKGRGGEEKRRRACERKRKSGQE